MDAESFYLLEDGDIQLNASRRTETVTVANTGDRPVQVGSHAHFFEVNRYLRFERTRAFGMRLDIAAGTAVRFEPGDVRDVTLVAFGGDRRATGMLGIVDGDTTAAGNLDAALRRLRGLGIETEAL